jgi:hypothetical protein
MGSSQLILRYTTYNLNISSLATDTEKLIYYYDNN